MIHLTQSACLEINRLRLRQNQPKAVCRLTLQPSSCAQWAYALSLEEAPSDADDVYEFDGLGSDGVESDGIEFDSLQLVVNRDRAEYIQGLSIDFAEDLTGGAFRFDNPLATESCRCGYAFAIR